MLSKDQPDEGLRAKHDSILASILSHASTSAEIRELCADLRVLGKGDFKSLLKWRQKIQTHLAAVDLAARKADGRWEAEEALRAEKEAARAAAAEADKGPALSPEQSFEQELRELRAKKALDAKKEKKKKKEMKAKSSKRQLVNAHNLKESAELIGGESGVGSGSGSTHALHTSTTGAQGGEDGLFTLRSIKSREQLEHVAETEGRSASKKAKAKAAAAANGDVAMGASSDDDDEDDDLDDDLDDDEEADSDEEALYARLLQEQNDAFEESTGKRRSSKSASNAPRNIYEDQEMQLLAKIKARDSKKDSDSPEDAAADITIGNVRSAESDESYSLKLERDLDFMYETYKDRRDIKSKNRNGGSELDMGEEAEGNTLLQQARKEEKKKLKAQAESKKRKREAGDSDTDDEEEDMDRFNSDDDESEDTADDEEGQDSATRARATTTGDDDDSDAEEGDNPLIRKLHRESAPSNTQRMARWFQRGLLAEADIEGESPAAAAAASLERGDDDDEEMDDGEERKEAPRGTKTSNINKKQRKV